MANPEHFAVLQKALDAKDISIWNNWREKHPDILPDLKNAKLGRADLREANLRGADLRGADLDEAILRLADLKRADLSGADIRSARLDGALLPEVDLSGAILFGVDFSGAWLLNADFTSALIWSTILANVDLSTVKGLETVEHRGPSFIDISTLYKSGAHIPESFLRGCGVPDTMIVFVRSLISQPIQFYSAFISCSSRDEEFAKRLHSDLQANHVRVWFAPEDLKIGEPIKQTIDEAVRLYDKLILVLSANSIDRAWVRHEFGKAIEKEKGNNRFALFPIHLDDSVFETTEQWAFDIRQRHIGDFRNWKNHDDYQKAFQRLLRDLQTESRPARG